MTCAAYQSCFILTAGDQDSQFNTFGEDSVPKTKDVGKGDYGLAAGNTKKSFIKNHYTIPMITRLESNDNDSIPRDSTNNISVKGMKRRKGK